MTPTSCLKFLPLCGLLAACGGGGGSDGDPGAQLPTVPTGTTPEPPTLTTDELPEPPALPKIGLDVASVFADGSPIKAADYVGRTFPLLTLVAPQQADPIATLGEIELVDADTLVIRLPGRDPLTLNRFGTGSMFGDGTGKRWFLDRTTSAGFSQQYLHDPTGTIFASSFGFETPVAARPATATYRGSSTSSLGLDGGRIRADLQGTGDVNLTAAFTGSGGTITGTLIDSSGNRDITGDGVREVFNLRAELDGVIVPDGFTGTVTALASARDAGETATADLNLQLSNSVVVGKFFGNAAEAAAGVFSADATATIPGQGPLSGTLAGHFRADAP
jgi:hypothetical protein